ncbi:MAG: hypothetical protein IPI46_09320 [Bacteroidetes bacterium]|nr:hypothetical protein [Bacteroidota bacterium]
MKKLILMMVMAMGFISSQAVPKVTIKLEFELARPKYKCLSGTWICNMKGGIDADVDVTPRTISSLVTMNPDGTMLLEFQTKLPEQSTEFYGDVDEKFILPVELAEKFGYSSIEIIPGTYRINPPSKGNYGSVVLRVSAR